MISRLDTAFLFFVFCFPFLFLLSFEGCQIFSDRSHGSCDTLVRPGQSGRVLSSGTTGVGKKNFNLSSAIVFRKVGAGFIRVKGIRMYVVGNTRRNHYTGE